MAIFGIKELLTWTTEVKIGTFFSWLRWPGLPLPGVGLCISDISLDSVKYFVNNLIHVNSKILRIRKAARLHMVNYAGDVEMSRSDIEMRDLHQ